MKYRIEVYEDHAILKGSLSAETLLLLVELCKNEGFTHLTHTDDHSGFKLIKKKEND